MRGLAEFIMRGRLAASCVAFLGYFLPLLTPVVIALVTLRRGATEGTLMLLISILPAVLWLALDERSSILIWITLAFLFVVYFPALVLRNTVSWPWTLLSMLMVCVLVASVLTNIVGNHTEEIASLMMPQQQRLRQ